MYTLKWYTSFIFNKNNAIFLFAQDFTKGMGGNLFDSNSFKGGNFFKKILLCMQINIFNAQTDSQVSICKHLDVTRKNKQFQLPNLQNTGRTRNGRKFIHN
jgi:hypothetical protein